MDIVQRHSEKAVVIHRGVLDKSIASALLTTTLVAE